MPKGLLVWSIELVIVGGLLYRVLLPSTHASIRPLYDLVVPSEVSEIVLTRENFKVTFLHKSPKSAPSREFEIIRASDASEWEIGGGGRPILDALNALISHLKYLELNPTYLQNANPITEKKFGLENPTVTIIVKTMRGSRELNFGDANDFYEAHYLKISEESGIWLAPSGLSKVALAPMSNFVFDASAQDIAAYDTGMAESLE